ncbi:hypothetical protein V2J09_010682 [Rumex salicifolius]
MDHQKHAACLACISFLPVLAWLRHTGFFSSANSLSMDLYTHLLQVADNFFDSEDSIFGSR